MDPCPVLVGRERELSALADILDAGGGVAVVSGEAGIGKSRLVREFTREAESRGRIVLWARPEEVAQPGPYALIVDLLESIAERGGGELREEARALAKELIPAEFQDRHSALATRTVAAELRGLLSRLGSPLVIFEDLQRADESSHGVIMHLARVASDDGHVVIGVLRQEGVKASPSLSHLLAGLSRSRIGKEIVLNPLGSAATAEMLRALWRRQPTDAEVAAITQLGEGIPFFIEELAESHSSTGSDVPRSIKQTVTDRLISLGPEGSNVLHLASRTLGTIDPKVLSTASGLPTGVVTQHLIKAAGEGLIVDREGNLTFRHALIRDAIAAEMVSVESMRSHASIARAIEEIYTNDLERFAAALAYHFEQSGETESAVKYFLMSGHRSMAFAATEEARGAFQRALELSGGKSSAAILGMAETNFRDGREDEASILFRSAADALKKDGENVAAAKALGRLAWTRIGRESASEVLDPLDEALSLLGNDVESEDYVRLLIQKGNALLFAFGRVDEATPLLEGARAAAATLGRESLLAEALDGLAYAAQRSSSWERAVTLGSEGCAAALRSQDPEAIGRTHTNHAAVLAVTGSALAALEVLGRARERLQREHGRAGVGALDVTHAWVARLLGRPREAAALAARSQAAWQRWRGYRRIVEVWSALERGDLALARSVVQAFWEDVGDEGRKAVRENPANATLESAQALLCETLLLLAEGADQDVARRAHELVAADRHLNEAFDLGHSLAILVRALFRVDEWGESQAVINELQELGTQYPYHRAAALELSGHLAQRQRNSSLAADHFRSASELFAHCSNESDRARCMRSFAEALLADRPEAQAGAIDMLKSARRLAEEAGAISEQNRIESELRALGVRPRAGRPRKSLASHEIGGLSPREAEVVALVAAGVTNADIGRQLFLSERTVQDHIGHALRKLSLSGRAALASWAVKQGMI